MSASICKQPEVFYFRMKCVLHQLHLVVGKMLNRLQGHFSAMAKIVNVWRSVGVPYKVSQEFEKLFGHEIAKKVRRLPPRPLRGRWGSISSAEAYLLESEPKSLAGVFKAVLGSTDCDDGGDDAITLDSFSGGDMDNATYRKIMGRWRRDAISALEDPFFWLQVLISFNAKQPLNHLMYFLMSNKSNDGAPVARGKLPKLVFGHHEKIMSEFSYVLDAGSSGWKGLWLEFLAELPAESKSDTVQCLVATTLEVSSEMDRRVTQVVSSFPAQLAWLVFQPHDQCCEFRMRRRRVGDGDSATHDYDS